MQTENQPPSGHVALCNRLNQEWLSATRARVEPWFSEDSHTWKIRMTVRGMPVEVTHLQAEHAEGHTYYLFAQALDLAYQRGQAAGVRRARAQLVDKICEWLPEQEPKS
jgi:hypothetical protein